MVLPDLLTYTWTGSEASGSYMMFLAAVVPGAFSDGSADPGDIIDLSTATFAFSP